MLFRTVRYADVLAEHPGRDFRPEFFPCVLLRAERPELPFHAAAVPSPVPQLMQGRFVIQARFFKVLTRRQVDGICHGPVKGPIALIVVDVRAGSGEDVFGLFHRLPFKCLVRKLQGRHSLDLFRIEDVGKTHDRFVQFHGHFFRLAVLSENRFAVFAQTILFFAELEIDHGRGLAAGDNAHVLLIGLAQSHPTRIVIAGKGQMHPVHAPVDRSGSRIVRRGNGFSGMPGLLPGRGSFLQALDDLFRELFMKGGALGLVGFVTVLHTAPPPGR